MVRPRTRINGKLVPLVISEDRVASILETESLDQRSDGISVVDAEDGYRVKAWMFSQGRCVGVIRASRDFYEKHYVIDYIVVDVARRREGIATSLYRALSSAYVIRHSQQLTEDGAAFVKSLNFLGELV